MEGIASMWSYQECFDALKRKLLYTNFELESTRIEAKEEMKKNEENVKQLLHHLQVAWQERDEARYHFQRLLNKIMPLNPSDLSPVLPHFQPENPHMEAIKANSSFTESDTLSETYNHHSYGSPPLDSDLSNFNNGIISNGVISSGNGLKLEGKDRDSSVIDNLIKGKPLPQKGRLLQSVMEAGPLLSTLLVAGPLPRWKNPPPPQPFQASPFFIEDYDLKNQNLVTKLNYTGQGLFSSSNFKISHGCSEIYPSSMVSSTGGLVSFTDTSRDCVNNKFPVGMRQRFQ